MIPSHLQDRPVSASERVGWWRGIQRKRSGRRWRRRALVGGGSVAGVTCLLLLVALVGAPSLEPTPGPVASQATTPTKLTLPDGSRVVFDPGTELEVTEGTAERVRLDLTRGRATFTVTHDPERPFRVVLPTVELLVVGTRFVVTVEDGDARQHTALEVAEGIVEVRTLGAGELLSRVHAGGRWSHEESRGTEPVVAPIASATAPNSALHPPGAVRSAVPTPPAAAALFDAATRARRAGDYERAIAGYEELLARYPDDRHTALAALELGRLKRTRAEDPRGAAAALEQAAVNQELSDDALAQLVLSHDQAGDWERCRAAQRRYLAAHPDGVHVAEVRSRCREARK